MFPISPRNSPEAISHLLSSTNAGMLLVSGEPMLQNLATASLSVLKRDKNMDVPMFAMPKFEDLYALEPRKKDDEFVPYPKVKFDHSAPALIIHSSGAYTKMV